jgi:DNA-binding response OmpR family regulator
MPGMDGFDLCTKIRGISENKATPVIFVTSLTDFKSRARSSLSGGTDLIAKPFMFMELSVKALTYVLRSRMLRNLGAAPSSSAVA